MEKKKSQIQQKKITNSTRIAGCSKKLQGNLGSNFNLTKFKENCLHKYVVTKTADSKDNKFNKRNKTKTKTN